MFFNATYPEFFNTINSTSQSAFWLFILGALFLLIFLLFVFSSKCKKIVAASGLNELWLAAFLIWFVFYGLGDVIIWSKVIFRDADLLLQPTEVRQGERLCDLWHNQFGTTYCFYSDFYEKLALLPKGSKIYWFPTPSVSSLYLNYWLVGNYKIVSTPQEADYCLLVYPTKPHTYRNGHLFEKDDNSEDYNDLGKFKLIKEIGMTSIFVFEK